MYLPCRYHWKIPVPQNSDPPHPLTKCTCHAGITGKSQCHKAVTSHPPYQMYLPCRYHWKIPVPQSCDPHPAPHPHPFTKCTCHAGNIELSQCHKIMTPPPHSSYQIYLTCRYHRRVPVPKTTPPSPPNHLLSHLKNLLTTWQCTHHVGVVGESHCHKAIPGAVSQSSQLKAHLCCVGLPGHDVLALWLPASLRLSVTPLAFATLVGVDRACDLSRWHIC